MAGGGKVQIIGNNRLALAEVVNECLQVLVCGGSLTAEEGFVTTFLSESTNGRPIAVAAASTTIHTVPAGFVDEITVFASNTDTAVPTGSDSQVALIFGGPISTEAFVPSGETVVVMPKVVLAAGESMDCSASGTATRVWGVVRRRAA